MAISPRKCIFCDSDAENLEHLFPRWLLKTARIVLPYHLSIAGQEHHTIPGAKSASIKATCKDCNCGWMSRVEGQAKKLIGPLSQDLGVWIAAADQKAIAQWAIKTTMVFAALDRRTEGNQGYTKEQCRGLRLGHIPFRTMVWLGRYNQKGLGAWGNAFDVNVPGIPHACAGRIANFLIDHLLIQVISIITPSGYDYVNVRFRIKPGPWGQSLIQIWPSSRTLYWPPRLSFFSDGRLAVSRLFNRLETLDGS